MMITPLTRLRDKVQKQRKDHVEYVITNGCGTIEDYRFAVGMIQACDNVLFDLAVAIEESSEDEDDDDGE